MRIFLSGPMGSGKSTVARVLARRLRRRSIDLDGAIAERQGQSVEEIFRAHGEAAFREMEREEVDRVLAGPDDVVVALGGGTVTDAELRHRLLRSGVLVTLSAPVAELSARVAAETGRPLLAGLEARRVLEELLARRADAYGECHAQVRTEGRAPEAVAEEVASVAARAPVVVPLGRRTYRVDVGRGVRTNAGAEAVRAVLGRAAVVVTDANVRSPWADDVAAAMRDAGFRVELAVVPPGEEHKTIGSVEAVWDAALAHGVDRDSVVIGVGGGVVGDLAGFTASTLLRGIGLAQVPTSLLAMVDSAVGGKTGFDRAQGKNLIGTFHQPRFVLCDVDTLGTLPTAERRSGLAEVVKSAWLEGEGAVAELERDAVALAAGDADATTRAIRMAVQLKARIVTEDEHETGSRRLLNLGHTIGHAIEAAAGYRDVRHGEAVALGMMAAFRVAAAIGRPSPPSVERMARLLDAVGLPTDPTLALNDHTLRFVASDKKRAGEHVRFVVPGAPGKTEIVPLRLDAIRAALVP